MSGQRKATPSRAAKKPAAGPGKGKGSGSRSSKPKKSLKRRVLKWVGLGVVASFLLGIAGFAYAYVRIDIPDPNQAFESQTTFVYYSDGKTILGRFANQNRVSIPLAEMPDNLKNAVIAAEDRTFWENPGIDIKGIIRAAVNNLRGQDLQGASTITQQYVKILYLTQERTLSRKIKEAILSLKIQNELSKEEILQGYLNTIYFGRGAYGVQAAAQAYFGVDAADLKVRQSAVLASVLNSPTAYDPANGKDARQALLERYRYVLSGMAQMGNLSQEQADKFSRRLPKFPKLKTSDNYGGQRGHILMMVKDFLLKQGYTEQEIDSGGLRIVTTIDKHLQRDAEKAVKEQKPDGFKKNKNLHVALASVEPGTGELKAIYAGHDYIKSPFNWAKAGGSPGSTFKPFTLAAGLESGYSLKSTFDGNSPIKIGSTYFENEGGGSGNDYGAHVTLLKGLEESINTVFIDLVNSMSNGPQKVIDTAVSLGIPRKAPGLKPETGVTLGSATVSPLDMATAYAGFADRGVAAPWYLVKSVTDKNGEVLYTHKEKTKQALPRDVSDDVTYALQQVVKQGTGTAALGLGRPAAGKTGTATNADGDVSSAWFVGFTPQLSTAVMYVRGKGNQALNGWLPSYYGGAYPARTWTDYMKRALEGAPVENFPPPANIKATNTDHAPKTPKPKPSPTPTPTPSPTDSPTLPTGTPTVCVPGPCPTDTPTPTGGSSPAANTAATLTREAY